MLTENTYLCVFAMPDYFQHDPRIIIIIIIIIIITSNNTRATGSISKSFKKIPEQHNSKARHQELHKTAILALHTYCGKYWCKVQNIERGDLHYM